ncbi:MAG: sulfatase-like hydrolase/transferase, partial [Gaiellaceae bacterium]
DIGFEEFVSVTGSRRARLGASTMPGNARWALEGLRARADDGADAAGRVVANWLASHKPDRPFFWFVNLVECHSPYLPPRPYDDLGPLDRLRAAQEARRYLTLDAIWKACAGALEVPAPALERMRRLYAASVRRLDDWLATVLEALDSSRVLDETLVIATSDHGENLGEGGLMGHAFSLDDRLIRVPFAWAGPGAGPLEETSSLVGLPRAVADATGLESHPWTDAPADPGLAVAEFDPPAGPTDPRVPQALDEWGLAAGCAPRIASWLTVATDGRWKLLRRDREEFVYDLETDPLEAQPLTSAKVEAGVVERLRRALDGQEPARELPAPAGPPATITDDERRRLEEQMELLGYM